MNIDWLKKYDSILAAIAGIFPTIAFSVFAKDDVVSAYIYIISITILLILIWFIYVHENISYKEILQQIEKKEVQYTIELDKIKEANYLKVYKVDYDSNSILISKESTQQYPMGTLLAIYFKDDNEFERYFCVAVITNPISDTIFQGELMAKRVDERISMSNLIVKSVITYEGVKYLMKEMNNDEK